MLAIRCGGIVPAVQVIVSSSHTGRCRDDAAFAALSGISPLGVVIQSLWGA